MEMRALYSSIQYNANLRHYTTNISNFTARKASASANNMIRLLVVGLNSIEGLITAYSLNHFQHHPDFKTISEGAVRKNNFKFQVDIVEPKRESGINSRNIVDSGSFTQDESLEKNLEAQVVVLNPCSTYILQQLHLLDDLIRDAEGLVLEGEVVRGKSGSVIINQDYKYESEQKYKSLPFVSFEKKKLIRVLKEKLREQMLQYRSGSIMKSLCSSLNYSDPLQKYIAQYSGTYLRGQYDLIVLADGLESIFRDKLFSTQKAEPSSSATVPGTATDDSTSSSSQQDSFNSNFLFREFNSVLLETTGIEFLNTKYEWIEAKKRLGIIPLSNNRLLVYSNVNLPPHAMSSENNTQKQGMQILQAIIQTHRSISDSTVEEILNILDRQIAIGSQIHDASKFKAYTQLDKTLILQNSFEASKNQAVMIGSAAHNIDNALWHQSTVDIEDGYTVAKCLHDHLLKQNNSTLLPSSNGDLSGRRNIWKECFENYDRLRYGRVLELSNTSTKYNSYGNTRFNTWIRINMAMKSFLIKKDIQSLLSYNIDEKIL